jgi:hypothetical protein
MLHIATNWNWELNEQTNRDIFQINTTTTLAHEIPLQIIIDL